MRQQFLSGFPDKRQRGVALISVLLVFALAAIIAGEVASRHFRDIKKTAAFLEHKQAYHFALAGEQFARQLLYRDFEEQKTAGQQPAGADTLSDIWANIDQVFNIDNGEMLIEVRDLQGRLNLNNLINTKQQVDASSLEDFERLQSYLGLIASYSDVLVDWIDSDQAQRANGAEDDSYSEANYLAANSPMIDRTELRLLRNMLPEDYAVLSPLVTALPKSVADQEINTTKYNINTVDAKILEAFAKESGGAAVEKITRIQQEGGYSTMQEWRSSGLLAELGTDSNKFDIRSRFFEVEVTVRYQQRLSVIRSEFYRNSEDGSLTLLKRQLGLE